MSGTPKPRGSINYDNIDRHLHRRVEAAEEAGVAEKPRGETMRCPCGHSGPPEVIIRHSEWDATDCDFDVFVCPSCGDA